jgi:hypothetical protein
MAEERLSDALGRATCDPESGLVQRMLELVEVELAEGDAPTGDSNLRRQRRWLMAVGTAAALVVAFALIVSVLRPDGSFEVDTATSVPEEVDLGPVGPGVRLMPTKWPTGLDGQITSRSARSDDLRIGTSQLLARDGSVAAVAWVTPLPLDPVGASLGEGMPDLAAEDSIWTSDADGEAALPRTVVANLGDRMVTLRSAEQDVASLLPAFRSGVDGAVESELPQGWGVVDDPAGLADVLADDSTPSQWEVTVRKQNINTNQTQRLELGVRQADPSIALAQLTQMNGGAVRRVDLGSQREGVLMENSAASPPVRQVFWAAADDLVAVATGVGLSEEELIAAASSAELVDATTPILPPADAPDYPIALHGFHVDSRAVLLGSGRDANGRWMLTMTPVEMPPEVQGTPLEDEFPDDWLMLHTIEPGGQSATSIEILDPASDGASRVGIAGSGDRTRLTLAAPEGLSDVLVTVRGERVDATTVPLPTQRRTLVIAVVAGALASPPSDGDPETVRSDLDMLQERIEITGNLPDGSRFSNQSD